MTKKHSRIIAVIMLVIAVIFIGIALNNPQASFPWSNTITYIFYGKFMVNLDYLFRSSYMSV